MKVIGRWGLALALLGCGRPDTSPVGQVKACDNGTYFSLKSQTCQALWGHEAAVDAEGFERIRLYNGITVPRKINGRSPFAVSVAYDVSRRSSIELVMKRVDYGEVGSDAFTDWKKIELTPGAGERSLVLTPNQDIPEGPAAAYVDGRWTIDQGYIIEAKGGDRFEDEDADQYKSWRLAGIQVDPTAPDDPAGKDVILGSIKAPAEVHPCQEVTIEIPVRRLNFGASFDLALKKPGSNWAAYGGQVIRVDRGFEGSLQFTFALKDADGRCAPSGLAARKDTAGQYPPDTYLFQLDIYTDTGHKLDTGSTEYTIPEGSRPVTVLNS